MSREFTHQIIEVIKKAPNISSNFDQERLEHLVSPACSAIAPPQSPCFPKSSILTETQAHYHDGAYEESTSMNGGRCTHICS